MIGLTTCVLGLAAATAPQNPPIFSINREVKPPRVSADRDAVTAFGGLTELSTAMGWTLLPEPDRVRSDLELVSLDLSFEDQDPRMIAQLLAAAGGVDVTFDDRSDVHSILHLIPLSDATSESGQERLRNRAAQWYQKFMAGELDIDHAVLEEAMQVRMHLGHLMLKSGDIARGIHYFQEIYDQDRTHDYVPTALLRMAESFYELGEYEKSEHWSRELMKDHPSLPETAAATVLLGRTLLAQDEFDACRQTMEQDLLRLSDSPEIIDLYLLLGEAEMKLRRPQDVRDHMEILGRAQSFRDLNHRQFLDFSFLYGYGSLGQGQYGAAVESLELFLVRGEDDPRKGEAFVMLGQASLAEGQVMQARSAALEARNHMGGMDEYWRTESRKLYARTALAVGDKEAAFRDLESEVRTTLDADLILFLIEEFIKERRYQRAITTAELLSERETPKGDQARYLKVEAMWKQARQTNVFDDFPPRAIAVAKSIVDKDLQSKVAEFIGKAYEEIGDLQKASEAFMGILR